LIFGLIITLFLHFYTFSSAKRIKYFMRIYFLSSKPCALKIGGVFFGAVDDFERFADVTLSDNLFIEFIPENGLPLAFFLTETIRLQPPQGCEVYLLRDSIALYARDFPPADFTLRPIAQKRFDDILVSVYQQGGLQLTMQTANDFFTTTLPPSFSVCTLSSHAGLFFIEGENCLSLYTRAGKCVFMEEIEGFSVTENELNATLPLSDALGRVADCAWLLDENGCYRTRFSLRQARAHDGETDEEKIADELLAYAFFESVLLGIDCADFLSDDLRIKAKDIVGFLGAFKGVAITRDPFTCGLIREKAPRLFELAYFTATVENGKITDITS
jgi:hypothetical protein